MTTFTRVPFVNLIPDSPLQDRLDWAYERVMCSGQYIRGKEVQAFEDAWAEYIGTRFCVATASGSDALRWLVQYNSTVVIVPWNSKPTLVALSGEQVKLVEGKTNESHTLKAEKEAKYDTVIPVHLYGCPADIDSFDAFTIYEDAAQAHGAKYKGRMCGTLADAAAWSFYPTKNLGAYGDAGAITTDHEDLAEYLRALLLARMDPLQAAFLRVKLPYLDSWNARRREIAEQYMEGLETVQLPVVPEWADPCWHLFVIRHPDRDGLRTRLIERGIETMVHYPEIEGVLSLPCAPHLSDRQVEYVIEGVNSCAS